MSSSDEMHFTPPDIFVEVKAEIEEEEDDEIVLLPPKSREKYLAAYDNFISWKDQNNIKSFSENVLLDYFHELSDKYKPSTLWAIYSMLKSTLKTKQNIDLKRYLKISAFIKRQSSGFISKKSKVLTTEDVEKYLNEAPDDKHLLTKVILIFGVAGAMRRDQLTNLDINDIEFHGEILLVIVRNTKSNLPRTFTLNGKFCEIVKKYIGLRVKTPKSSRFFQNYQHGRCFAQNVGINKIGSIPKRIATFLKLPNPEQYTGHSFRRSSAALFCDSANSMENRIKIARQITDSIKIVQTKSRPPTSREGPSSEMSPSNSSEELPKPPPPSLKIKFSDNESYHFEKKTTETTTESIRFERPSTLGHQQISLHFTNCSNVTLNFEN